MSKPAFSFGLKKAGPAKPAPTLRKPAPFGRGGDDDGSEDEAASSSVVQVSQLDNFSSAPFTTTHNDSPESSSRKRPNKKPLPSQPPQSKPHAPPSKTNNQFTDLSSALTSRKYTSEADASIYDYDAAYDSFKAAKASAKDKEDGAADPTAEKKPRYFASLQRAADIRERDRQIAEERRLQRERVAEGDAFADKEKFVTEAYKRQQEENRRVEEEEERREADERKKNKGRGLADFYKGVLERGEREHAELVKAAEEGVGKKEVRGEKVGTGEEEEKSAAERAKEINAKGGNVLVNEEGEVVDKRQLLKGGLNVAAKKKVEVQQERARQEAAAARTGTGAQSKGVYVGGGKQAMRERQTRMLEAQLEETLKRSRQEEEQEAAKIELAAKSRKTESDISSAKERYLARKRAAEEAKKNGLAEGP